MRKSATIEGMGSMRGSVSGSLWALIVGGVGLGVASQISGPPARQAPVELAAAEAEAETVPTAEVVEESSTDSSEVAVADDDTAAADEATTQEPLVPEPVDETPAEPVIAPDRPVVPGATEGTTPVVNATGEPAPELPATSSEPEATDDAPVAVAPAPEVPEVPAEERELTFIETLDEDTEAPPETTASGSRLTPAAQALLDGLNQDDQPDPSADDPIQPDAEAPVLVETAPAEQPAAPEAAEGPAPEVAVVAEEPPAPAIEVITDDPERPAIEFITEEPPVPDEPAQPVIEEPAVAEVPAPSTEEEQPEVAEAATSQEDTDTDESLPGTTAGVRVNRPGAEPADQAGQESAIVEEDAASDEMPAMMRYAAAFENPQKLPMLSFALIDDGSIADPAADIAKLGLPVTVILDPLAADATARMAALRAAGIEVGFQASLPEGATPADVEIAMEAALGGLPEAVTLYSDGQDGVQQSRAVTGQVLAVLAAEGRGLVIAQRGLGNALRNAGQAGVPAAEVARDIDGNGQSEAALGRSLDQAAFRARQTGTSVLVGTLNSFNLAALATWAPGVDQDQLLLAPVTGVLRETVAN